MNGNIHKQTCLTDFDIVVVVVAAAAASSVFSCTNLYEPLASRYQDTTRHKVSG